MAFGWPTRYLKLDVNKVVGGVEAWDRAVRSASDEYNNHVVIFSFYTICSFFSKQKSLEQLAQ